jgi:tRNA pseudouridine55 synthase
MIDGVLVIDKPAGMTSHDVVNRVRRLAGQRRVGHAGTLDPLATGVLLVCLGRATRVAEYLAGSSKHYRARVRLGVTTDTQDADGQVLLERPVELARAAVEAALAAFRGKIEQVPPMYSAVKHQGRALYKLAREGMEVERRPRTVEVFDLALTEWAPPELELAVRVSAGTYVRTLAHDLGERLGCGAHLTALRREASGVFTLAEATPLAALEAEAQDGAWRRHVLPVARALRDWPAVHLDARAAWRLENGQALAVELPDAELACAFGPGERLLGLVRVDQAAGVVRPEKIFANESNED